MKKKVLMLIWCLSMAVQSWAYRKLMRGAMAEMAKSADFKWLKEK